MGQLFRTLCLSKVIENHILQLDGVKRGARRYATYVPESSHHFYSGGSLQWYHRFGERRFKIIT